jgi:hypothetical protein
MMALAAGIEVARDVRDLLVSTGPTLAIVDCMLSAGLAAAEAAEAAGMLTVSLVHFPYGLARRLLAAGDAWTTDLDTLDATRRTLGLAPTADAVTAWEAVDLVLVTAPRLVRHRRRLPAARRSCGSAGSARRGCDGRRRRRTRAAELQHDGDGRAAGVDPARGRCDRRRWARRHPHARPGRRRVCPSPPRRARGDPLGRPRRARVDLRGGGHARGVGHDAARARARRPAGTAAARSRSGLQRGAGERARCRHPAGRTRHCGRDPSRGGRCSERSALRRRGRRARRADRRRRA